MNVQTTRSKNKTLKYYNFNQSPFYKLKGKATLETLLKIDLNYLDLLLDPKYYRVKIENSREVQVPKKWLEHVHKRIATLLSKIETPTYLQSKKNRSYITNAAEHYDSSRLINTDITKYFPSTSKEKVYQFFLNDFLCSGDIARHLADICCFRQKHVPTGSSLSQILTFFVSKNMFDEIHELAVNNNCKMTIYVDDITISGNSTLINKKMLWEIRQIIRSHGYKTKNSKSTIYTRDGYREVTGVGIKNGKLLLPNRRILKKLEAKKELNQSDPQNQKIIDNLKKRLKGRRLEQIQINKANNR